MGFPSACARALLILTLAAGASAVPPRGACPVQTVHPAWAAGVTYRPGDLCSYLGVEYVCLAAHLSKAGQEPPAAPALWRVFGGPETHEPAVPKGLAAVADGPTRIVVGWSQVAGAASYDLLVDGVLQENVANPWIHKDLVPESSHAYRVRAVAEGGRGAWSDPVTARTAKP